MPLQPSEAVLKNLGVQVIASLGGRLNQHWLVESHREQLVLRRWVQTAASINYEMRLLSALAARGWPVAPVIDGLFTEDGDTWALFAFLPGEPLANPGSLTEQRARGRLMAQFHADLAWLNGFGQRETWRRCEEILNDTSLDRVLAAHEASRTEEVRVLRWHLERARGRLVGLSPQKWPGMVIHGDFTPWNLRFQEGQLSGILDFELAHWDHRVGDFALSWRGKYDAVIHGYNEISPLTAEEWELITPLWWAGLIDGACRDLSSGIRDDGWTIKKLLQRSPLMRADVVEYD